jgi:hypothetical protein
MKYLFLTKKMNALCSSFLYLSFGITVSGVGNAQEVDDVSPKEARALVKQWVQVEQTISQEQRDWTVQKSAMNDLIDLYQTETSLIEEELEAAGTSTDEVDGKMEALKKQTADFKKQREELELITLKQSKDLLDLAKNFPEPLKEQIKVELAVIDDTESTLRERSVALLNALKAAGQFNNMITYTDLEQVVGGTKRQLRVLFLGLGQAFYVSGDQAGIGKPVNGEWKWREVPNSRARIAKAIAIYQKTARPELISLPVEAK